MVSEGQDRTGPAQRGQGERVLKVFGKYIKSGQVRTGQVRTGQVKTSQVKTGQVKTGQVKTSLPCIYRIPTTVDQSTMYIKITPS